jgi:GNAT superfamily N-acetyltransferase
VTTSDGLASSARAWQHARHDAICDTLEPWAHGTVVRASRYPSYYDFNLVRVEDDPGLGVDDLVSVADQALAGLAHRRIDFDLAEAAEPLRRGFEARGWKAMRLLFMRHEGERGQRSDAGACAEEVPYNAAHDLRAAWHREDFGDRNPGAYFAHAREVALRRGVRVLVVRKDGVPVAFAQLIQGGSGAEITDVYVHPEQRGRGLGTAITGAAIEAAAAVPDLWIAADDEDRPKELYARLGFRPVWTSMEFTRLP